MSLASLWKAALPIVILDVELAFWRSIQSVFVEGLRVHVTSEVLWKCLMAMLSSMCEAR